MIVRRKTACAKIGCEAVATHYPEQVIWRTGEAFDPRTSLRIVVGIGLCLQCAKEWHWDSPAQVEYLRRMLAGQGWPPPDRVETRHGACNIRTGNHPHSRRA